MPKLQYPETRLPDNCCPESNKVRRLLRKAMNKRLYNQYHPFFAYHTPALRQVYSRTQTRRPEVGMSMFKNDYIFQLQSLLLPSLRDGDYNNLMVDKIDFVEDDIPKKLPNKWKYIRMLQEAHKKNLKNLLWGKIRSIALSVATALFGHEVQGNVIKESLQARNNNGRELSKNKN
jgi:hypothetical protein